MAERIAITQAITSTLMVLSAVFLFITYWREPPKRLILFPLLAWVGIGIMFYAGIYIGIIPVGTDIARLASALYRLYESVLIFGVAIVLLWKPRKQSSDG
jgi:hypothetical protein